LRLIAAVHASVNGGLYAFLQRIAAKAYKNQANLREILSGG